MDLTRALIVEWPEMKARPVQAFQYALVYELFGKRPLGYHILSSTSFFCSGSACFMWHCALSPGHRLISVGTTVLYGLLPQYSTDRVWHPILVANLTMALYFLSLFADLKQLARRSWIGPWKVVASASLVLTLLAYDLFSRFFR